MWTYKNPDVGEFETFFYIKVVNLRNQQVAISVLKTSSVFQYIFE